MYLPHRTTRHNLDLRHHRMCKTCSPPRCSERDSFTAEYGHRPKTLVLHMCGENRFNNVSLRIVTLTKYRGTLLQILRVLPSLSWSPRPQPYPSKVWTPLRNLSHLVTSCRLSSSLTAPSPTVVPYVMNWRPGVVRRLWGFHRAICQVRTRRRCRKCVWG